MMELAFIPRRLRIAGVCLAATLLAGCAFGFPQPSGGAPGSRVSAVGRGAPATLVAQDTRHVPRFHEGRYYK